jgi:hypothetical protein
VYSVQPSLDSAACRQLATIFLYLFSFSHKKIRAKKKESQHKNNFIIFLSTVPTMDSDMLILEANSSSKNSLQPELLEDEEEANSGVETAILNNLVVLPPLQKAQADAEDSSRTNHLEEAVQRGLVVMLPPLRAEEPVASIRAAMAELVQYAHYTRYKLQLEPSVTLPIGTTNSSTSTSIPSTSHTRSSSTLKQQQQQKGTSKKNPSGAVTSDFPSNLSLQDFLLFMNNLTTLLQSPPPSP